ncbi:hypothetical protein IQ266_24275 [filamentous cyanobacterium LEGE 11480]|uniref:Uncharacterized protein n=1 Tax=Romeriopsis navalis LEGE 11480 TaxID=2777977 RepID=A0A928VUN8_9CYAN|nr:hypothetical protein [Romeriopsis navalis]MBE9032857.1 hypothetical protein [Romeriopsis navalis LEGE 11480]
MADRPYQGKFPQLLLGGGFLLAAVGLILLGTTTRSMHCAHHQQRMQCQYQDHWVYGSLATQPVAFELGQAKIQRQLKSRQESNSRWRKYFVYEAHLTTDRGDILYVAANRDKGYVEARVNVLQLWMKQPEAASLQIQPDTTLNPTASTFWAIASGGIGLFIFIAARA